MCLADMYSQSWHVTVVNGSWKPRKICQDIWNVTGHLHLSNWTFRLGDSTYNSVILDTDKGLLRAQLKLNWESTLVNALWFTVQYSILSLSAIILCWLKECFYSVLVKRIMIMKACMVSSFNKIISNKYTKIVMY